MRCKNQLFQLLVAFVHFLADTSKHKNCSSFLLLSYTFLQIPANTKTVLASRCFCTLSCRYQQTLKLFKLLIAFVHFLADTSKHKNCSSLLLLSCTFLQIPANTKTRRNNTSKVVREKIASKTAVFIRKIVISFPPTSQHKNHEVGQASAHYFKFYLPIYHLSPVKFVVSIITNELIPACRFLEIEDFYNTRKIPVPRSMNVTDVSGLTLHQKKILMYELSLYSSVLYYCISWPISIIL